MKRLLRLTLLALGFAIVLIAFHPSGASAKTYSHGTTIWFRDATIGPDDVVDGDLNVVFGNVTCEPGGWIRGDVHVYGGNLEALDGCRIDGQEEDLGLDALGSLIPSTTTDVGTTFFEENRHVASLLLYGIVVLFAFLLFPVRVRLALERVERHPGLSAVVGTLGAVAVVPIFVLLVLSIIGIPLVVVEIAALLGGLCIGFAAVAILIGRRLFELLRPQTTPSPLGALVLGLVVIGAAQLLPGVGWAVSVLVGLIGLGATILAFVRESAFANAVAAGPGGGPQNGGPPGSTPMRSG